MLPPPLIVFLLVVSNGFSCIAEDSPGSLSSSSCRCLAGEPCWPGPELWESFNSTVGGRLISVNPPAAPCHPGPGFDPQSCKAARENWNNYSWRSAQPGAYQENFWEQLEPAQQCPINGIGCSQGLVPVIAVNASQPSHVQSAVRFASAHNLRLVIKNTGHDYNGRSRAAGSFAIWLRSFKDFTFHSSFTPSECPGTDSVPAVTVGAGVQWGELYAAAYKRGLVVVGGGCGTVGAAGGHPQGGGHSPVSPSFGLAADNILELEVVTADGELVVANACQNRDLFWALRGGGGGTFGVVVSVTYKTHPTFNSFISTELSFTAPGGKKQEFKDLMTTFTAMTPGLSDAGWSGYAILTKESLVVAYLLANRSLSVAQETLGPLIKHAETLGLEVNGRRFLEHASYHEWLEQLFCDNIEVPVSRLIPRETFLNSSPELAATLTSIARDFDVDQVMMCFVAGGQVSMEHDNAVSPAWRRALWMTAVNKAVDVDRTNVKVNSVESQIKNAGRESHQANARLRNLTPGSGAYLNEADYNEPEWQQSLFGDNYPRLLEIKQRYDPDGLFVCHHCVGSELWEHDLNCKVNPTL